MLGNFTVFSAFASAVAGMADVIWGFMFHIYVFLYDNNI